MFMPVLCVVAVVVKYAVHVCFGGRQIVVENASEMKCILSCVGNMNKIKQENYDGVQSKKDN